MGKLHSLLGGISILATAVLQAQVPVTVKGTLPEEIHETSGLVLLGNRLITHNDSGNPPILYELDTATLQVVRQVEVAGVVNRDWEDLAVDETYLYVGDFGNNAGMRTDLQVLRIALADFRSSQTVNAEVIAFAYEDQTDFSGGGNSDWDAEAMVVRGDSLLVFTKQWQTQGTVAYSLPKTPGTHMARRQAQYAVGGLITGATREPSGGLVLLGYSAQLQPFLLRVPELSTPFTFPDGSQRESLQLPFGQTEGITSGPDGELYISSESFSNALIQLQASLFVVEVPEEPTPPDEGNPDPEDDPAPELRLYRPLDSPELRYVWEGEQTFLAHAVFDTAGRQVLFESAPGAEPGRIDVSGLRTAVYYLTLYLRGKTLSKPFLRY